MSIQFPIADARPFVPKANLRLPLPDWPDLNTSIDPQFVRYFGKAIERRMEPDQAWPDESKYILAKRGLRFDRLETRHAGLPNRRFRPRCAYRRLLSDGQAVVRAEIGIAHSRLFNPLIDLSIEEILTIIREISETPTMVPGQVGEQKKRPILAQGKFLARLYANASINSASGDRSRNQQLVEAADPLVIAELDQFESSLDIKNKKIDGLVVVDEACVNGARALYCRLETSAGIVSTWVLQRGAASTGQLRNLRLCLSRLHAEREVLDLILKQIHRRRLLNPPSEEAVDLLDQYFNERIRVVNREEWGGLKQSAILSAFDATQAVVRPASEAQLISRYEGGRRQVWQKIAKYQEERRATRLVHVLNAEKGAIMVDKQVNVSGTGNIVNVADYMSNVSNTVTNNLAESGATDEVKKLIEELNSEIQKVSASSDPAQVKQMGKNLKALSEEVASDEPERRWYEVSLEGIKEAAETIGEIAKPVISITKKLAALLLV